MKNLYRRWFAPWALVCALVVAAQPWIQAAAQDSRPNTETMAEDPVSPRGEEPSQVQEEPRFKERPPLVVLGGNAVLKADEVTDAVVVIAGSATVRGKVRDAVVAVGGDIDVYGDVGEAAVAVFGSVHARPGARVDGPALAIGGSLEMDEGARIDNPQPVVLPNLRWLRSWLFNCAFMLRPLAPQVGWVWVVAGICFLCYLLVAVLFPRPVEACAQELMRRPATSFMLGLLTIVLLPFVILLLAATGLGLIVVPFLLAALFLGGFVGKVGLLEWMGLRVGQQFAIQLLQKPVVALFAGAAIVAVLYNIPVLGLAAFAVVGVWALGGAMAATFGSLRRETPARNPAQPGPEMSQSRSAALSAYAPAYAPAYSGGGGGADLAASEDSSAAQPPPPETDAGSNPPAAAPMPPIMPMPVMPEAVTCPRAGFLERMAAGFLDIVLLGVLTQFVGNLSFGLLIALAYFAGMWTWRSTTVGGIVLGLKVVRLDGQPVTFVVALVRGLAAGFSTIVLFLGFLWIAWDKEKQGWHDKIAGTTVIKTPRGTPLVCL